MARLAALVMIGLLLGGCVSDGGRTPVAAPATSSQRLSPTPSTSPRYDFAGVVDVLADGAIAFDPLTQEEFDSVTFVEAQMFRKLARVLTKHPDHYVVGIHLGRINVDTKRLQVSNRISYVVEVTGGEPDGNCLDVYDAMTGRFYLGSCFHTDRENPFVTL